MARLTKKQKAFQGKVDSDKLYALIDAIGLVKECANAKFDESVDVAVQLGIDAKKSDQVVRGAVVLPNGTGKNKRVAVFAQGAKAEEAKAAGADIVGMEDLAARVKAGDMPFDVVIAAPDAMRIVGTLGQILGPLARPHFLFERTLGRSFVTSFDGSSSPRIPLHRFVLGLLHTLTELNLVSDCTSDARANLF